MKPKDKKEIIRSFNEDVLPMFEESKYQKGIDQVNKWKKIQNNVLHKFFFSI